jgi:hypothetical protein
MQQDTEHGKLKGIWFYIRRTLKFYELQKENVAPVIFTIILILGFSGAFIPGSADLKSPVFIIYNTISLAGIYLVSLVYQYACIKELKGEEYSLKECALGILAKMPVLVAASIIFLLGTALGLVLLVIPGFVFNFMFLFYTCFIIDKKAGVIGAFSCSKKLSHGRKLELFSIVLLFNFIILLPTLLISMSFASSDNTLVFNFVLTFISGITNLMQHRLTALMYVDLEYSGSPALE